MSLLPAMTRWIASASTVHFAPVLCSHHVLAGGLRQGAYGRTFGTMWWSTGSVPRAFAKSYSSSNTPATFQCLLPIFTSGRGQRSRGERFAERVREDQRRS